MPSKTIASKVMFLTLTTLLSSMAWSAEKPPQAAMCETCHGANGAAPLADNYPKINGQNKTYFVNALKEYKNGLRKGPLSAMMMPQASALSDEQMQALADYYADK
jgi:cytochrome c